MAIIKGAVILLSVFVYILAGLLFNTLIFFAPRLRHRLISRCTRALSSVIMKVVGIKLHLEGELSYFRQGGNFIACNHMGYLDGIILSSLFPVIFVTKLQVKSWPIFGWMSQIGCTIYIDRSRKLGSMDFISRMSAVLKEGVNILFFPEGTSTDGSKILPFHQAYFQAPLASGAAVIPVTIQYTKINNEDVSRANRDKVCWYGQVNFATHLAGALKQRSIEVRVIIHPRIETADTHPQNGDRKQLCEATLTAIAKDFTPIK